MKMIPKFFFRCLSLLTIIWTTGLVCRGQVAVTVSPSVTSNMYSGMITLNITGLTNGQPVKVRTYLDVNGTGIVQANDPMIDVLNITDGGAQVIGGITNISVPYDLNPTTGAITATLSFAPALENMVGQKIYQVNGAAFTPVTAVLEVTNSALAQSVSGVVYSNGIAPFPNAVVVALTASQQNYVGATIADASGHYYLTLNPGDYIILPAFPGFFTDQFTLPQVNLTNGMSATNNLTLMAGTTTISGTVYDAGNSNGLGGIFLQAQSSTQTNSYFEVAFTDKNGNYTIGATSNNWKIKITGDRLGDRGYLAPQNNALSVDASFGSVANANLGLYPGNALVYGQVTISGVPVANTAMACNDNQQMFDGKAFTDLNGNYAMVALVNTNVLGTNATWNCNPNTGAETGPRINTLNNYIFSQTENVAFTNNQAVLENFIGLPVTATISGRLVNNQGAPVSGLGVGGNATIDGYTFVTAFQDTDTNGDFSFGATSGQWYVNVNCCGNDGLDDAGYYDPTNFHLVNIPPTNPVVDIVIYPANVPLLGQAGKVSQSQFNLNLYGANGFNYTVQASTNLSSPNWSTVTIVTNLPGSPFLIQDLNATNKARFYRAFQGP